MDIDVDPDKVKLCGQILWRPSNIAPSQWLSYWERVKTIRLWL